jgi:omega-6 fatty acid desaturase (delta-12 desaturase)
MSLSDVMLSNVVVILRYGPLTHGWCEARFGVSVLPELLFADWVAAALGVLLFHLQHVYEPGGYVVEKAVWKFRDAALQGSSYVRIPSLESWKRGGPPPDGAPSVGRSADPCASGAHVYKPSFPLALAGEILQWFTCGIQYHHIHHYRTNIPGYKLKEVHERAPLEIAVAGVPFDWVRDAGVCVLDTPWHWRRAVGLQVWDEAGQRFQTFKEAEMDGAKAKAT